MGMSFGLGLQRLVDAHMLYHRNAHPVYLRLRNFPEVQNQQWAQMGFVIAPTGSPVGTTDVQILPQPAVRMVSMHNIGMSEGKLRLGARYFLVSATFVDAQVRAQGLSDQDLVWRGSNVVGLVLDNQLFSIVDIRHKELAGKTITFSLTCNGPEKLPGGQ